MVASVKISSRYVGADEPIYIVGEIGINDNEEMEVVKNSWMLRQAAFFQRLNFKKRTLELSVMQKLSQV